MNTSESFRWMFLISLIFNLVVSMSKDSTKYMLILIEALQLVLYLPLLRFVIPSNFIMMSENLRPIAMFDVLENNMGLDASLFMNFDEEAQLDEAILDQMADIGFESNNSIKNLGTMYFVLLVYLLQVVLVLLFLVCNKITGKGTKALNTLWRKLFFAPILIIVIEGFMDLSISGIVQL